MALLRYRRTSAGAFDGTFYDEEWMGVAGGIIACRFLCVVHRIRYLDPVCRQLHRKKSNGGIKVNRFLYFAVGCLWLLTSFGRLYAADGGEASLEGTWIARSIVRNGKQAPDKDVAWMRFRFQGEKLFVRGNFAGDKEVECTYRLDEGKDPKHLDFTPSDEKKPVRAILKRDGSSLTICIRPTNSEKGRPEVFESKPGTETLLVVFELQKER